MDMKGFIWALSWLGFLVGMFLLAAWSLGCVHVDKSVHVTFMDHGGGLHGSITTTVNNTSATDVESELEGELDLGIPGL